MRYRINGKSVVHEDKHLDCCSIANILETIHPVFYIFPAVFASVDQVWRNETCLNQGLPLEWYHTHKIFLKVTYCQAILNLMTPKVS